MPDPSNQQEDEFQIQVVYADESISSIDEPENDNPSPLELTDIDGSDPTSPIEPLSPEEIQEVTCEMPVSRIAVCRRLD